MPGTDFSAIREEFDLPTDFPAAALSEADEARRSPQQPGGLTDATDLPLVTIDPPGARDLDQALAVERRRGGFRVYYAIADLAAFVRPEGALDREAGNRGQTVYLPDGAVPLHPPTLSESAASLLPGQHRRTVLWTIDTDSHGEPVGVDVRRALVRSTAQFDYASVERSFATGTAPEPVQALAELGPLRRELAVQRGAIELQLPEQEVVPDGDGSWAITLRPRGDVDAWNAEISLMTGMCAAQIMLEARVGILRTLPDAEPQAIRWLQRSAKALGIGWPDGADTAKVLAGLAPDRPESLALFSDTTRLLRGAGYTAFDGEPPEVGSHAGIGGPYAHVTAPIRRLVDRYATEVCLAVTAGRDVPEWVRAALTRLPGVMSASDTLAGRVERACIDLAEVWLLAPRVGETFEAVVLRVDGNHDGDNDDEARTGKAEILIDDPPVLAKCPATGMTEGQRVTVRLISVDADRRTVSFERA